MKKRPVCALCIFLILLLRLLDFLGFPLVRGNPFPDNIRKWIRENPQAKVIGEVEEYADTQFSSSVCLRNTYLLAGEDSGESFTGSSKNGGQYAGRPESGRFSKISIDHIRVFLKEKEELPRGSLVLMSGKLEEIQPPSNPGEFDSRQYYACRHIYYVMKDAVVLKESQSHSVFRQKLSEFQTYLADILDKAAGESAPVFRAVVLGDKSSLEQDTKMRYQLGGIIHILAISGLHISMLGMGLYNLLKRTGIGIWPSAVMSFMVMIPYGMMTGGSVSTMRAVCMFLISAGAKIAGRIYDMPTALAVAAVMILAESPAYLADGGFLLSFGAAAGAGIVLPYVVRILEIQSGAAKAVLASVIVQLVTLPVVLWFYGEVSLAGIFLNLLVLPTVGIVLASGVGTALVGAVTLACDIPAFICAVPGRILLVLYEKLCGYAALLPFGTGVGGRPKLWQIAVFYSVLWCALLLLKKRKRRILSVLLAAAAALILGIRFHPFMEITCLDVGQGEAAMIRSPEGFCFLVDGGSMKDGSGQYRILPFLKNQGISRLDGIFVSHTDADHISGIRELLEFMEKRLTSLRADVLYLPDWKKPPSEWKELSSLAGRAGVRVQRVKTGDVLHAGKTEFIFLSPQPDAAGEDVNEECMTFLIRYGRFQGMFMGDLGKEGEKILAEQGILEDVDFLKVGHHGSKNSTGEEFLSCISPEYGVISCSRTNRYGHPAPETLQRLSQAGCRVFCTMECGAVTVRTDGEREEVSVFLR